MIGAGFGRWLQQRWYRPQPPPLALRPLAALYGLIADHRRRQQEGARGKLPLPLIVVGNISLGGTGKTPLVLWLLGQLRALGYRPGVISRGYGGRAPAYPYAVGPQADPALAGDEPVLIAARSGVPVVVAPDRLAAARYLIDRGEVDVLVADDGLQHYRLPRNLEICVVDGARGLGNGWRLPAGPLRESAQRLDQVALVVANGGGFHAPHTPTITMHLVADSVAPLAGGTAFPLDQLRGRRVHAIAGIGHPQRFFDLLTAHGLDPLGHAFADHHRFTRADLAFGDGLPLLMTEKDAVKCRPFAQAHHHVVPVTARIDPTATAYVQQLLLNLLKTTET